MWVRKQTLGEEASDPVVQHKSNTFSRASAHLYFNIVILQGKASIFRLYPRPGTMLAQILKKRKKTSVGIHGVILLDLC